MHVLQLLRLVAAPVLLLGLATPLSANSSEPTADAGSSLLSASPANAAAVLYALEAALDTRDQERALGLFTADAHLTDRAVYLGTDQVRAWVRGLLADDTWLELTDEPNIGPTSGQPLMGAWAVAPASISRASYRRLNVDPQQATVVAIVQGTQIGYLAVRSEMLWARRFREAQTWQLLAAPAVPPVQRADRSDAEQAAPPPTE